MNDEISLIQKTVQVILGGFTMLVGLEHLKFQRQELLAQTPQWLSYYTEFMNFIGHSNIALKNLLGFAMVSPTKFRVKIGIILSIFYALNFPDKISQHTNEISAFDLDANYKRFIRLFFQPVLILWVLWPTGALV
ncbi:hypothetical protein [Psychroflexus sp. MBR-150]|jgi:hypothetical protein